MKRDTMLKKFDKLVEQMANELERRVDKVEDGLATPDIENLRWALGKMEDARDGIECLYE